MRSRSRKIALVQADDELLSRLADGYAVMQEEFDQVSEDLPPEDLARALEQRWRWTQDHETLQAAAGYFLRAGDYYRAFELCTRGSHAYGLRRMAAQILPRIQRDYPDDQVIGKLLEDVFLVIDFASGKVERFQGLLPAREWQTGADEELG